MKYYVVGKLKYIIEEIVLLLFREGSTKGSEREGKRSIKQVTQIEEAVSKLNEKPVKY